MEKLSSFLNPIKRMGNKKYTIIFALLTTVSFAIASEFYAYMIAHDPEVVGLYVIFVSVGLVIYFSFRDGIKGGYTATFISIVYFLYIISSRDHSGDELQRSLTTTLVLCLLFLFLASVIGWLRQIIDNLIEREANERIRLETIMHQLPVGVIVVDKEGKIIQTNRQINELMGYDIPIGVKFYETKNVNVTKKGKDMDYRDMPLYRSLQTGQEIIGEELTVKRKGDTPKHLQVNSNAIHSTSGEIMAAVTIVNDITHKKEMEERKDEFINMASHELKTPLTSLKLNISILLRKVDEKDEFWKNRLASSKDQIDKLEVLVNDLLDTSRIQTGKLRLSKQKVDLQQVVKHLISSIDETSEEHEIVFKPGKPLKVNVDTLRINQVIINLITNAIKYSPDGTKIYIEVKKDGNNAVISVRDEGIGINKNDQKKIFEKMYQVYAHNEKTYPGLGMGLYISKEIVKSHNGKIWVESKKNNGSTFYVSLPLAKAK